MTTTIFTLFCGLFLAASVQTDESFPVSTERLPFPSRILPSRIGYVRGLRNSDAS